jgi:hypothetical protein
VVEVEAQICMVLDFVVIPSPSAGLDPLRRGITSVRASTLGPVYAAFMILSFHCAHDLAQGLRDGHGESRDADPPMDASGWHASNGAARAREERERDRRAASWAVRKRGTEVPTRSASSGEGEMERGVTPPPPSPPCAISSWPRRATSLSTGPSIGEHRSKCL